MSDFKKNCFKSILLGLIVVFCGIMSIVANPGIAFGYVLSGVVLTIGMGMLVLSVFGLIVDKNDPDDPAS